MEKEKLKDYEEAALLANVPYLINENFSINDIEDKLQEYGLDYKIDKENSDIYSAILYNDKKVIHSVRGTDFGEANDIIADLGLFFTHPTITNTIGTLLSARTLDTIIRKSGMQIPQLYKSGRFSSAIEPYEDIFFNKKDSLYNLETMEQRMTRIFMNVLEDNEDMDDEELDEAFESEQALAMSEAFDEISRFQNIAKNIAKKTAKNAFRKGLIYKAVQQVSKYFLNRRIGREYQKNDILYNTKYDGKEKILIGHSLGGLVNLIGRNRNIKTITLNPAPQNTEFELQSLNSFASYFLPSFNTKLDYDKRIKGLRNLPNKNSIIYKTKNDIVSFFLKFSNDPEKIIEIDTFEHQDPVDAHLLYNFLPKNYSKPQKNQKLFKVEERKLIKNMTNDDIFKLDEDYCKNNPFDSKCLRNRF